MSWEGRGARCNLVKYKFELRINQRCNDCPMNCRGGRKGRAVREVYRRGVGEMAQTALLVFVAAVVPVRNNQERKRKHQGDSCHRRNSPNCCVLSHSLTATTL
jgi:hypothetical protein